MSPLVTAIMSGTDFEKQVSELIARQAWAAIRQGTEAAELAVRTFQTYCYSVA